MERSRRPSQLFDSGSDRRSILAFAAVALVILLGVGVTGFLILERLESVENRLAQVEGHVAELRHRVEETVDLAARAAESSNEARETAVRAEENASEAARGRATAEEARLTAESERLRAEAAAQAAREEADLAREETERIQSEREAELDRLQEALSRIVETRRTALGLVMDLGSDSIEFEFDRADLGAEERELLSRIAGVLLTSGGYSVYVYGHTDDVGTAAYNLELSERRAAAVRDYLVTAGISPGIITTEGYGKSSPRAEGTSTEARARNRRVEVGIVDVTLDYLGEVPSVP